MATTERARDRGETKRYLVKCDGCSFEQTAEGRAEATQIGTDHQQTAGHSVVAVEAPPSPTS